MAAAYLFFEIFVINYRPVLIEGILEASYPSSTTLLAMCVMPTAAIQLNRRIKSIKFRKAAVCSINIFTVFMVLARLISGVHWLTDIIGGIFLSMGLVLIYYAVTE
jgi:undecaprenyl-diphosphatase